MRHTTHITIEHVVVSSERSYEGVKASLEARMGLLGNTDEFVRQVAAAHAFWEQVTEAMKSGWGQAALASSAKSSRDNCSRLRENPGR